MNLDALRCDVPTAFPEAQLLRIYGATETSPIATLMPHEEPLLDTPRAHSCGQPEVGVDVHVRGLDETRLPSGQVGGLMVRGPNVMAGYWNKPVETAAALIDGWHHSDGLIAHCRSLIASYKIPKAIDLRSEPLPKSGAGKVLKRELRESYGADTETRVAGA